MALLEVKFVEPAISSYPEYLLAVAAWRDAPYFTDAERAALALAEAVTRIGRMQCPMTYGTKRPAISTGRLIVSVRQLV